MTITSHSDLGTTPCSEREAASIKAAMSPEQISAERNAISDIARQRMDAGEPIRRVLNAAYRSVGDGSATVFNWMTQEESDRFYHLGLALPTQAEEIAAARQRIARRIADRRSGPSR